MSANWLQLAIIIVVIGLTVAITIALAVFQSRERLRRTLPKWANRIIRAVWRYSHRMTRTVDAIENRGEQFRPLKDRLITPVVDGLVKFGFTPNRQTLVRGLLFASALGLILDHRLDLALVCFIVGSLLDLTDGATARRYPHLATPNGKFLDPLVDVPAAILFSLALLPYVIHPWVILTMGGLHLVRAGLFVIFRQYWAKKLGTETLPKTLTGEEKALWIAVGFGLIMLQPESPLFILSAEFLLLGASLFEVQSFWALFRSFQKLRREYHANQPRLRPTGTTPLDD